MRLQTCGLVDLSQAVFHGCPAWADYDPVQLDREYLSAVDGFNAETARLNTHTGTHVDVPFHFFDHAETIDQVALEAFAGPAALLDLRGIAGDTPIGPAELEPVLDAIRPGEFAILVTGWSAKRALSPEYLTGWPYLSGDGAELLLEREVKGVGIDALSIGGWGDPDKGQPSHKALLGAGKVIVEELKVPNGMLDQSRRWYLTAFPVLLQGAGGAWARAVAWPIDEE